jgi:hypothetical protein
MIPSKKRHIDGRDDELIDVVASLFAADDEAPEGDGLLSS